VAMPEPGSFRDTTALNSLRYLDLILRFFEIDISLECRTLLAEAHHCTRANIGLPPSSHVYTAEYIDLHDAATRLTCILTAPAP